MNWQKYKEKFAKTFPTESQFILGIDIGSATSAISYLDLNKLEPEVIDISGGYGKPTIPTAVSYIKENEEWVFGEYALLHEPGTRDSKFTFFADRMGKNENFYISGKYVSMAQIYGKFLTELISSCKNLNPKAEIAGIVISVPPYASPEALFELRAAAEAANIKDLIIDFMDERLCAALNHFYKNKHENAVEDGFYLLIDFGANAVRGDVFISRKNGSEFLFISNHEDARIGEKKIHETVKDLFTNAFSANMKRAPTAEEKAKISDFTYGNKDLLFQKSIAQKPIKLYYNFVNPPFAQAFGAEDTAPIEAKLIAGFKEFLSAALQKTAPYNDGKPFAPGIFKSVICAGGGFESVWAKNLIKEIFGDAAQFRKNSKAASASGAALAAAAALGVVGISEPKIADLNILRFDYGVKYIYRGQPKFFPLANAKEFWRNKFAPKLFILNDDDEAVILKRSGSKVSQLAAVKLDGLPNRPRGTAKLKFEISFTRNDALKLTVEDFGFGELFPKTDYKRDFIINLD